MKKTTPHEDFPAVHTIFLFLRFWRLNFRKIIYLIPYNYEKKCPSIDQSINQSINGKSLILFLSLAVLPVVLNAQIKIDSNGKVGLHATTTSPSADVLIQGSARIQNVYGGSVFFGSYYSDPELTPGSPNTGKIGLSTSRFQYMYCSYINSIGAYIGSDRRIKENIREIENPLAKVLQMKGQKYDFLPDSTDLYGDEKEKQKRKEMKKDRLGFVAQDLLQVLPEVVRYDEDADQYSIEYTAIIPVLAEAIKEQQLAIEQLSEEVEELKNGNSQKSASLEPGVVSGESREASLEQNIPNPFSAATRIGLYLPETVSSARLYLYNMQGSQIKSFDLNERGNTSLTIDGYTLDAGMYLYTLIADGREVDTKRMILTK